jgi:chitodextrinase
VVRGNVIRGGFDDTGSHNEAVITFYGARDFLVENNTFDNVTIGIFIKGTDSTQGNRGIIRYNLFTDVRMGIEAATTYDTGTDTVDIYQNIITLSSVVATHALAWENATGVPRYVQAWNNTLIGTGDEEQGIVVTEPTALDVTGGVFRDNIIARFSTGGNQVLVNAQTSLAAFDDFDHNLYYSNGGTPLFYDGSIRTGLAAWQSATSRDALSDVDDPDFENQSTGDYRLATGSPALTLSSTGGAVGAYITGSETIGAGGSGGGGMTVPDAPTIGSASAGDTQATVTFTAPGDDGGSTITGYTVTSSPGSLTATGASSPLTVTGLTNGVSYTFTVIATNAEGNSSPSSASNSVTPAAAPSGAGRRMPSRIFRRGEQ